MHPLIGRRVEGPTIGPKRIDERGGFVVGHVLAVSVDSAGSVLLLVTPDGESMAQCHATHCRLRGDGCQWQSSEEVAGSRPHGPPPPGYEALTTWVPIGDLTYFNDDGSVLWRRMIRPVE
jgi:hypothetical protein